MRDNLKEHIENHRDEFDSFDFDADTSWNAISQGLKQKKIVPWMRIAKMAIAACLLVFTGLGAYHLGKTTGEEVAVQEWVEAQQYYEGQINSKLALVQTKVNDPFLLEDMADMDQAISELKNDLKDNVDNAEVVEAMMENYRLKLKILESILEQLSEDKNENNEIHL